MCRIYISPSEGPKVLHIEAFVHSHHSRTLVVVSQVS